MARPLSHRLGLRLLASLGLSCALLAPSLAQAKFIFPYNHPDLNWYTIETEHFNVHYPVSKKTREEGNEHFVDATWSARKTARVSEEMYEPMCEQFDYYLLEKVNIVILDQGDTLQGFTIPSWDWVEISANPGSSFYRTRGRMEWFSDVLVHEYAHVISLKRNAPFTENLQAISIGGLYSNGAANSDQGAEIVVGDTDPFWWTEGGAEYWSDQAGYNWWTPSREMNLRTTVLEDRLLTFDEWSTRIQSFDWGDGERGYQQGYSIAQYLRMRFGDRTFNEFAMQSDKKWRAQWENIIHDVTGVKAEKLYDDWKAFLERYYQKVYDDVLNEGEVVGRPWETSALAYQYADPAGRDKYLSNKAKKRARKRRDYEADRYADGTWDFYPKMSDDGTWSGEHARGTFSVAKVPEQMFPARSGDHPSAPSNADIQREMGAMHARYPSQFAHSFDFIPGRDAAVVTSSEDWVKRSRKVATWARFEGNGYDWKQLAIVDFKTRDDKRKHADGKERFQSMELKRVAKTTQYKGIYTAIPNTLRGSEPAVSPDGKRVAYHEYRDGRQNLVVIDIDGQNKTYLTDWKDGVWLQGVDWSPDGTQLVFSVFKNYRQDMYTINADGSGMKAINADEWEDQDAHWAKDGKIYFSSDATGIFNIYRYDPESGSVQQLTNVIGGAQCPWITPAGDLLFTNFTAHGWKNFTIAQDELFEKDATDLFTLDVDVDDTQKFLSYFEDLSEFEPMTKRYSAGKSFMSPTVVPILRVTNDSQVNWGLSAGAQIFMQDFAEKHSMFINGMVGEDPQIMGQYQFMGWHPTFRVFLFHGKFKTNFGYIIDDDDDPTTTDDQAIYEVKQIQYTNQAMLAMDYPINSQMAFTLGVIGREYGFKSTTDKKFLPYMVSVDTIASLTYRNLRSSSSSSSSINPRGGRVLEFGYTLGYSDIVYRPRGGHDTDDGEILDKYAYNQFEFQWTEMLAVNLSELTRKGRHTLQIDFQAGAIDRNVQSNDEFRAGARHPYFYGPGALQPNTDFSGYPQAALLGETKLILSAAYRFPLISNIRKGKGLLYARDLFFQFGGTVGNLWSFRPPEEEDEHLYFYDDQGQRVAYDPGDIRREVPFVDYAYKNGNFMLGDVVAELRFSSVFMGMPWNSFFRASYAMNSVTGIFDVNNDGITDASDSGIGTAISNEVVPPGMRFMLGIGTGW